MPFINRAKFLKSNTLRQEKFYLGDYGFTEDDYVVVRELQAKDIVTLQSKHGSAVEEGNYEYLVNIVRLSLVDDKGVRMFGNEQDLEVLLEKDHRLLTALATKCMELTGMIDEQQKKS